MILNTDRAMEFIHIKDMRAAGFEPTDVLSGYQWKNNLGYYQSTKDASTNFYIQYMPKGNMYLNMMWLLMHQENSPMELQQCKLLCSADECSHKRNNGFRFWNDFTKKLSNSSSKI
jgi:hypothetical protein